MSPSRQIQARRTGNTPPPVYTAGAQEAPPVPPPAAPHVDPAAPAPMAQGGDPFGMAVEMRAAAMVRQAEAAALLNVAPQVPYQNMGVVSPSILSLEAGTHIIIVHKGNGGCARQEAPRTVEAIGRRAASSKEAKD